MQYLNQSLIVTVTLQRRRSPQHGASALPGWSAEAALSTKKAAVTVHISTDYVQSLAGINTLLHTLVLTVSTQHHPYAESRRISAPSHWVGK